jgi:predicted transcriptional regulator of viral defense system
MSPIAMLARIEALGQPMFETRDLAALLNVADSTASRTASRLAAAGLILKLGRGKWALSRNLNRLDVPEFLTSPFPSYISLQSALYHHAMISQIPAVIYAISLARTRRYQTPIGTISIHRVEPEFFFGYELDESGMVKIATPEKALVDVFYLSPTRSRLFKNLPEIEFPHRFSWTKTFQIASKIESRARRTFVKQSLESLRHSIKSKKKSPR